MKKRILAACLATTLLLLAGCGKGKSGTIDNVPDGATLIIEDGSVSVDTEATTVSE